MSQTSILTLRELEAFASEKADKTTRDYWTNGAGDNSSVSENLAAFNRYRIRPRMLRNVKNVDMSTTVLGRKSHLPIGLGPSGMQRIAHPDGEEAIARAAASRNLSMTLSTFANTSVENVKKAGGEAVQFLQLYIFENREVSCKLIRRAETAGYGAIMLTVDTPVIGRRITEIRNQFKIPAHLILANFDQGVRGPLDLASEKYRRLAQKASDSGAPLDHAEESQASVEGAVNDSSLTWEETIPWLRSVTKLPIWLKGILTAEDTHLAIKHGVDGILVSNHGGRQLESCVATLDALPEVVAAANGRIPTHVDGGIRRGSDVFKALALGADYVWIARPAIWGLAYDGQTGVELAIDLLKEELRVCMAVSGCRSISEIDSSYLGRMRDNRLERL